MSRVDHPRDQPTTLVPAVERDDLSHRAHTVQFYGDAAFLLEDLSRFIGGALGAGDAAVVLATEAHRDGLEDRMTAGGVDVTRALDQGRYIARDAAAVLAECMVDGWPDAARFTEIMSGIIQRARATAGDDPRVVVFGELVALLCTEGQVDAALRLEELWNALGEAYVFNLHCAYPLDAFPRAEDGWAIEQVCTAHAHVVPAESYTALPDDPQRLRAIALWQQKAQALETEIAERERVEVALRQRNRELDAAIAARDAFLSVAAHELKTPLTSLRAFAQLLLRDARQGRETSRDHLTAALSAIEAQTGKLSDLVARLLDTAQIESGRLRIEPVPTDVAALLRSVLAAHARDSGHPLVVDAPDRLEARVDPLRFEQVITNLLDNAVKFSPGGGEVAVALGRDPDGDLRLTVTDQGIGIPPEQREAVFHRFYQASAERHLSGLGLGLYITREIVHLHGGAVHIEDPPHPGSRFVVTLPPSAGGGHTTGAR